MREAAILRIQPGTRIDTPLSRLASTLATLSPWGRYTLTVLLGAIMAAAMPPVDMSPVVFICLPGLLWLDDGSPNAWASFRLGYAFSAGFFVAGMYWIAVALFVDIAQYWWALPFAVLGVPALLAFFGRGDGSSRSRDATLQAFRRRPRMPLRGLVVRRRMDPRPHPDGLSLEPRRLCLVGRVSGRARPAAGDRVDRHLRPQLPHHPRRRGARAPRQTGAGAALDPGHADAGCRRRADSRDPRDGRGDPARPVADRADRHGVAAGAAVYPANAALGPRRRRGEFSSARRAQRHRRRPAP